MVTVITTVTAAISTVVTITGPVIVTSTVTTVTALPTATVTATITNGAATMTTAATITITVTTITALDSWVQPLPITLAPASGTLEHALPEFESWLYFLLTMWPLASYFISLLLNV